MPSGNRAILASAGSGKTTELVRQSCGATNDRSAVVTYTINGSEEIAKEACRSFKSVPPHVSVGTWYSFVLAHLIRPYQNHLYMPRVSNINFHDLGPPQRRVPRSSTKAYYFSSVGRIWRDRATEFAAQLIEQTGGKPIRRIEKIFQKIYIDEAQDLSGWDLEILEALLNSNTTVVLAGDCRQATYSTNNSPKNKAFSGEKIVNKFRDWEKRNLLQIEEQAVSWRCNQAICDFADDLFPAYSKTTSKNVTTTGHDGVFLVRQKDVEDYCTKYSPKALRYDKRTDVPFGDPSNFGESKGLTFDRTLIFPHGPLRERVTSGKAGLSGASLAKAYVGITRARHSVGIVVPDKAESAGLPFYGST